MTKIENALGKKIQITNSPIYNLLKDKRDFFYDMDYENLLLSTSNLATTLGGYVGADQDLIKLYVALYGLGCVHGGPATLQYINAKLNGEKGITQFDILLHNLKKVFPDANKIFTREDLIAFSQLFSGECTEKETQVIRAVWDIKEVAKYYESIGQLDPEKTSLFTYNGIKAAIDYWNNQKKIILPEEYRGTKLEVAERRQGMFNFTESEKNTLDGIVDEFLANTDKHQIIENLNRFKAEKKRIIR